MPLNVRTYLESIGQEVEALKFRVRHLIADAHWQTEGEWKESVVRQILRRHLPLSAVVGRGFVLDRDRLSSQVDVLIYDGSKPVLFKDGDLVFVTPDCVLGIIEVKSRVTNSLLRQAAKKLSADIGLVRIHGNTRAFAALFAFESDESQTADTCLDAVVVASETWNHRVDFVALGRDRFIKYWNEDPMNPKRPYYTWHSYRLPNLAAGFFFHNVIDAVSPESVFLNSDVWFPSEGKEPDRDGVKKSSWL